jgi:flagellar assembly protein FliH
LSNLLKRSSVINKDERVIDYNDLIKKKIQAIMESKHNEMDADGFINGLHADVVDELISDDDTADALTEDAAMGEQQAAASLENTNAEAERIIEEARLQAEQIIADANKNADAAFEEAKQNGYYEGNEKAQEEMNIKQAQLEAEFDNKRKELEQEYNNLKESIEPELVEVITDVFRKVTGVVAEDNQEIILHLINDVMHNADGSRDYVIKVSPDDYKFLVNNQGKIYCAMSREVNIDIVEDATLERNQCMIETNTGIFNCSLDIELNNLIKNIKLLSCV